VMGKRELFLVTFKVLTAESMKTIVFSNIAACSLVKFTDVSDVLSASET
jgi:hypothetical protein